MHVEECIHQMATAQCAVCSPSATTVAATHAGPFVWISPAPLYHLADCVEVDWDPTQAKHPGERFDLAHGEVRRMIEDGLLERGCRKCGANVEIPVSD